MQNVGLKKKSYTSPSMAVIGSIAEETKTGWWWRKESGPGDQYIMTDPASCFDSKWWSNCEDASA